jgi:hypothetical protein
MRRLEIRPQCGEGDALLALLYWLHLNDGSGKALRSAFPLGVNGILSSISKWLGIE